MQRRHRYYDLLLAAVVVVLLCSNFIGAGEVAMLNLPLASNVEKHVYMVLLLKLVKYFLDYIILFKS